MSSEQRTWMAELDYTRPNGVAEVLRVSYGPIGRFPASCPDRPNAKSAARIVEVPAYSTRIYADASRLTGDVGVGTLSLSNADRGISYLRDCAVQRLRLWWGVPGTPLAEWTPVVDARPEMRWDLGGVQPGRLHLAMYDLRADLEDEIQPNQFAGTNSGASGYEGGASDAGRAKPLALGDLTAAQVPAQWANAEAMVAQLHDGAFPALAGIYDRGGDAGLTLALDGTGATFDTVALDPDEYGLDRPRGLVKLGGKLGGEVTFGLHGAGGDTVPSLLRWLLERRGHGARIGAELDALTSTAKVGVWIASGGSYRQFWDQIAASDLVWCVPDALGVWRAGRLGLPVGAPVLTLTEQRVLSVTLADQDFAAPAAGVEIRWGQRYRTFSRTEMAPALLNTAAEAELSREWRTAVYPAKAASDAIKARWPGARTVKIDTALREQGAAEALAEGLFDLLGPRPDNTAPQLLRVVTELAPATLALVDGKDEVHLRWPAEGIDDDFVVWGKRPAATAANLIELELFR